MTHPPKISSLSVTNFTCFQQADFVFSPGINVFIGENGTGKTHILKLLYAVLKGHEHSEDTEIGWDISGLLLQFFKPEQLGQLVNSKSGDDKLTFSVQIEGKTFGLEISESNNYSVKPHSNILPKTSSRFIPAIEMLTLFEGFTAAYENRESAFDHTYYLGAKALDPSPLKGKRLDEAYKLSEPLYRTQVMKVLKQSGKFYIVFGPPQVNGLDFEKNYGQPGFKFETSKFEASLVAEGIKKIGQLMYLIKNGSITKDTILFWDEPEAHLNPRYITIVADFLLSLAASGMQIFVATHDYLLSHRLSLAAEYRDQQPNTPDSRFFGLSKGEDGTIVESGDTLVDIENNPILDEFARFYDYEQQLFFQAG